MTEHKFYCPICRKETIPQGGPDDTGTQFYKCLNGHQTAKPLNKEEKEINNAFEIQAAQNGEKFVDPLNPLSAFCDGKGIFKPALVAEWIKINYKFKTDLSTGLLYFYDGKTWLPDAEPYLKKIVSNLLGEEDRKSHYDNIKHHLTSITYETLTFGKKIAALNGLLDPEIQTLTQFDDEEMPLYSIPTEYVPNSPYPQWQAWLDDTMPNKEDQKLLQECSGFILLPDYRFHSLLFNYGTGRNGKGTWERTIQAVIGRNNCSEVALEEFNGFHRFALIQLYGKLLNLCSEPTAKYELQTALLKKATGQDEISAERKGSDKRIKFTNAAKIVVSANKFPKVEDQTIAFKERRLFLNWEKEYLAGAGQIQVIERNWTEGEHDERKGILCWMLEGLKRLLEQGHFTQGKTQKETEVLFQRASNSITAFKTEMLIFNRNRVTSRNEAFEVYKEYCDLYGLEAENEKRFTQALKETPRVSVTTVSKPKRESAWKGIGLKSLNDDESVTDVTDVTHLPYCKDSQVQNKEQSIAPVTSVTRVTGETYSNRYCHSECANFDKPTCTAPNWRPLKPKITSTDKMSRLHVRWRRR